MNQLTLPHAQLTVVRVTQADINVNALSRCLHTTTIAATPDGYRCVEITGDLPDRRYCRALVKWKESDTLNFEVDVGIFGHREGQSLPALLAGDGIREYSDLGVAFNGLHARKNTLLAELDAAAARERQKSPGQLAYERDLAVQPNYEDGARRRSWDRLGEVAKDSWERNPTDRKALAIAWVEVERDLHVAKVDGVQIGSVERNIFSDAYDVCLYRSAESMGSQSADADEAPNLEAGKARLHRMVEAAIANRTPSALMAVLHPTPAGPDASDSLGWLYGEAQELKAMKVEINGDYTAEDLETWDDQLAVAQTAITLLKEEHPALYQQLQQRARNLVDMNRESLEVKERERDAQAAVTH